MRLLGLIGGMSWNSSAQHYRLMNQGLRDRVGPTAKAIVLGCTEVGLLLSAGDCPLPLLDTTALHAEAAAGFALSP